MAANSLSDFSKIKALVADESNASREALASTLRSLGLTRIDMAHSRADALNMVSHRTPDLILCDYHLGSSGSGQALLEEGRRRELIPPHCTFIMVTSERDKKRIMAAAEWQPDDYLLKPFTAQSLLSRVERSVSQKYPLQKASELIKVGELDQAITELRVHLNLPVSTHLDNEAVLSLANATTDGKGKSIHPAFIKNAPRLLASQFNPTAIRLLIETLLKTGQVAAALDFSAQSMNLTEAAWAKLLYAKALILSGSPNQAIPLLTGLIEGNPHYMKARDELQQAYQLVGDFVEAQKVIEAALSISPYHILRHSELGVAAFRSGDYSKAIIHLEEGMHNDHLSSFQIDTWAHLLNALLEQNQTQKAYNLALEMSENPLASTESRQIALAFLVRSSKALESGHDGALRYLAPLKESFESKQLELKARPHAIAAAYAAQELEFAEAALISSLKSQTGSALDFSYLKMVLHKLGYGQRFKALQEQVANQRVQELAKVRQFQQNQQWQEAAYYLIDLAALPDASIAIFQQASQAILDARKNNQALQDDSLLVSQFLVRARQINPYHALIPTIDSALHSML